MSLAYRHRRWFAGLACLAILARLAIAIVCAPQSGPTGLHGADDLFGQAVICTSHGAQSSADPSRDGDPNDPAALHCAACTLVQAALLGLELASAGLIFALIAAAGRPRSIANRLADHLRLGGIRSRAPPLSA